MLKIINEQYRDKIQTAMFDAVLEASLDKESNTVSLMAGEIVDVGINVIAFIAATSHATKTTTLTRKFSADVATKLRVRIPRFQEEIASGKLDFMTVVHADEKH